MFRSGALLVRQERIPLRGIRSAFRIVHLSDVHFSKATSFAQNEAVISAIVHRVRQCRQKGKIDLIAVTGDLVSRQPGLYGIPAALKLMALLRGIAPVVFSLGNHETDLPAGLRAELLNGLRDRGVLVLDNTGVNVSGSTFRGLTLPGDVYKGNYGYRGLRPITAGLVKRCIGQVTHPCVLLAHTPTGFPAYARWGADLVLSGHMHGGIMRVPGIGGILSPERKFFPVYDVGLYQERGSILSLTAGIGKFRICDPAEIVDLKLIPVRNSQQRRNCANVTIST